MNWRALLFYPTLTLGIAFYASQTSKAVTETSAKFEQSQQLRDYLLATTGKVLVEASPQDRIWGAGLARDDAALADPEQWLGDNLLGFALMKVRSQLLRDAPANP